MKNVDPRVFTKMLWKNGLTEGRTEGSKDGRTDGRMDGNVTISLRNFVGEGIIILDAVEDYARRWIEREVDQDPELESLSD